ncbi:hypothetical protein EYF80_024616 [Liparis tanakae]|uniref:Uncharacterized protein n=1 Tax=Liparis tanakae TaxID=230148 RepID=A0A4Z2HH53_9TELE|nr:hypothetical protein EYF80_024616 [Liparis tanakae]
MWTYDQVCVDAHVGFDFLHRNSCKVKQKDVSGQVSAEDAPAARETRGAALASCGLPVHLLKDDHHGGHATDEEKLASSVGVKPDKEQSALFKDRYEDEYRQSRDTLPCDVSTGGLRLQLRGK